MLPVFDYLLLRCVDFEKKIYLYREMCENEPNLTFLTLAMTFRMIQSNPSLHSLLSPSWGSFMPK